MLQFTPVERLFYVTSNKDKIESAKKYLNPLGINFESANIEFTEQQSEKIEEIALSKAEQAFKRIREPLFVNDAGWSITALNGFPGPFMKYISKWFIPQDFLNLMAGHKNREVVIEEVVVYKDQTTTQLFRKRVQGVVLNEIRGDGLSCDCVVSLSASGKSIAECAKEGIKSVEGDTVWSDFAKWLKENNNL